MAKDILKEAIADAKAVREVALANAKAALEEAFTPKLQSMISAKIREEAEVEDLEGKIKSHPTFSMWSVKLKGTLIIYFIFLKNFFCLCSGMYNNIKPPPPAPNNFPPKAPLFIAIL